MAINPKSIAGAAKELGSSILNATKDELGDVWEQLTTKDRKNIEYASKRFARLSFDKLRGVDVESDLQVIEAILKNLKYVQVARVHRAFWNAVRKTVGLTAEFLNKLVVDRLV